MSRRGQSGAPLGQSPAFPAETLQPRERLEFWVQFLRCSFGWVFAAVAMGRNRAAVTFGPSPVFSGKLLQKKHHTTAPCPASSKNPLCTKRSASEMPLASSHTGNHVERGLWQAAGAWAEVAVPELPSVTER